VDLRSAQAADGHRRTAVTMGRNTQPACHPRRHWQAAYHQAMNKPYFVRAEWDGEAAVWVATSDDVPGLITEAATIEALDAKLKSMVPELLEANGCMPADGQVTVELLARRFSVALPAAA
jgi:predicted RNase H-like HicB family nuclease